MGTPHLQGTIGGNDARVSVDALGRFDYAEAGFFVAGFGNLRFADSADIDRQREHGTAAALAAAWRRLGVDLPTALRGDFAIACWNGEVGRGLIAVDRFATHSLYWAEAGERVAFSTRPADVPGLVGRRAEIDPHAIHAYLYFHVVPAPLSICQGVARLDVGEAVHLDGKHPARLVRYWMPAFEEGRPHNAPAERKAFLAAVRQGVAEGLEGRPAEQIGCFLSGGTDSSTISGLATELLAEPVKTFSITFDLASHDEGRYSRLAARHFGTHHTEHVLTPDEVGAGIEQVSRAYEQPFGNASALPTWVCATIARTHGITRMLGGDGGDELYGGNKRYATARLLSYYQHLPAVLRARLLEPVLLRDLESPRSWPIAKLRGYVAQASTPMPDQMQRHNLLNRLGVANVFTEPFLEHAASYSPRDFEREIWQRTDARSLVNRCLAYDFKITLGDSDLPKVTRMCHLAGVEVAFPMLADVVVSHSMQLAPGQKLRGLKLRHFFRESLRGFLPDEIIDKSKQGFGMPFGQWLLQQPALAALADDALRSVATRGLIRPELIAELRQKMAGGHAGYYGTMIWILMMLEFWFRQSPFADYHLTRDC